MESIHQRIKRLRLAKGLSQEKLAAAVKVKYQSVQEWERPNGTAPRRKRLESVALALGVTPHELLTGTPPPAETPQATTSEQDPRAGRIAALFYWLTEKQKKELMGEVESMATANRAITRELRGRLDPVTNERVEKAFKKRTKR